MGADISQWEERTLGYSRKFPRGWASVFRVDDPRHVKRPWRFLVTVDEGEPQRGGASTPKQAKIMATKVYNDAVLEPRP